MKQEHNGFAGCPRSRPGQPGPAFSILFLGLEGWGSGSTAAAATLPALNLGEAAAADDRGGGDFRGGGRSWGGGGFGGFRGRRIGATQKPETFPAEKKIMRQESP